MDIREVFSFIAGKRLAVVATAHIDGGIEAALVGFAITSEFQLVFDTQAKSRKAMNLRRASRVAMVVGWDDETTVQIEGYAIEPTGAALMKAQEAYFKTWPEGRARATSPDLTYFVIKPTWLRYSQYEPESLVQEFRLN